MEEEVRTEKALAGLSSGEMSSMRPKTCPGKPRYVLAQDLLLSSASEAFAARPKARRVSRIADATASGGRSSGRSLRWNGNYCGYRERCVTDDSSPGHGDVSFRPSISRIRGPMAFKR